MHAVSPSPQNSTLAQACTSHGHSENSVRHGNHTCEDTTETQDTDKLQAAEILLQFNGGGKNPWL